MNESDDAARALSALFEGKHTSNVGTVGTPLTREMWEQTYGPGSFEEARKIWPWLIKPRDEGPA